MLLNCERFAALRAARNSEQSQATEPLEILEDFARHAALALTYDFSPVSKAITQAIQEVHVGRCEP